MMYNVPTLIQITDVEPTDDYPGSYHFECRECGERIEPTRCADSYRQYIRGFGGELFDATSMNRPDVSWRFTDKAGHEHRWHVLTPVCSNCKTPMRDKEQEHPGICICGGFITDDYIPAETYRP